MMISDKVYIMDALFRIALAFASIKKYCMYTDRRKAFDRQTINGILKIFYSARSIDKKNCFSANVVAESIFL